MAKIKTLKQDGEELLPRTHVKAVMKANDMTLETYLGLLESRLAALQTSGASTEEVADTNAVSIHGADGVYDLSKGTIQARLNTLEGGEGLKVEKKSVDTFVQVGADTISLSTVTLEPGGSYFFGQPFQIYARTANELSNSILVIENWNKTSDHSRPPIVLLPAIVWNTGNEVAGYICALNPTTSTVTFTGQHITIHAYKISDLHYVSDVSGNVISGGSGDVTKSYVDSQDAALDAKITTAQQTADSAVTMSTDAGDKAEQAVNVANTANTTANNAKNTAENAQTEASGATSTAQTANKNATDALSAIGSKSSAVTFSSLWSTIGAWNESATITARLKDAYNWALNSRSSINGAENYPTDKATINARLNTLEENRGSNVKIVSGNGTLGARTGEELSVDFTSAGFTVTPNVIASYYKTGDNDTEISGIVKVWNVTETGCKISITGGAVGHSYSVAWIATGK